MTGAFEGNDDIAVGAADGQRPLSASQTRPQPDFGVPLQDQDINVTRMSAGAPGEQVKTGTVASSRPSVLHRPRPKQAAAANRLSKQASNNNVRASLFSIDTSSDNARPSSFFGGGGLDQQQQQQPSLHSSSVSSAILSPNTATVYEASEDPVSNEDSPLPPIPVEESHNHLHDEQTLSGSGTSNRHSFYGLDQFASQSPNAALETSISSRQPSTRNSTINGDSGSGSRSSFAGTTSSEMPSRQPHQNSAFTYASAYRQNTAPYASSRAASVYGTSTAESIRDGHTAAAAASVAPIQALPLLDHSHLKVGPLATLLSQEKTLELYRANARKTSDPDVQFEFAIFCLEVVGEMDAANMQSKDAAGTSTEAQTADEKKSALVSESIALLSKLATRGHVKSQYFLADCYTQGVGTPNGKRDYAKAFPLFVLAGKHGHPDACYRAAQCCEFGWGCRKDANKAVQLYKRGAIFGHPESMHRLGLAELNGELGLSKKPKDGVKWLKRAADLADQVDPPQPVSLHELALLHEKGMENVIFRDEEYAAELLARAAELQYAPSAYKLGECYEYGKMGCPKDSALSIHYYNIAAQQNHPEACFALTAWYLVGSPGVLPQSDTEAYLWALKAAEMGLAKAQYAVGYFVETGSGTYKDARDAIKWYQKAAQQGDKRAVQKLRQAGKPIPVHELEKDSPPLPPSNAYKPPASAIAASKKRLKGKRAESVDRKGTSYGNGKSYPQQSLSSRSEGGHDVDTTRRFPTEMARPEMPRRRSVSVPDSIYREVDSPMPPPLPVSSSRLAHGSFPGNGIDPNAQPQYSRQPPLQGYPVVDPSGGPGRKQQQQQRFGTPRSSSNDLRSQAASMRSNSTGRPLPPGAAPAAFDQLNAPLPRRPDQPAPAPQHSPELAFTSRMLPPATLGAVQAGLYAQAPPPPQSQQQQPKRATLQHREPRRNKDDKDCVVM